MSLQLIFPLLMMSGFTKQELEVPGMTLWVATGDLDGDTLTDLIVSYKRGSGPKAERYLAIFFRGPEGYGPRPDVAFAPLKTAGMFDIGDSNGDGVDEILYVTPGGVFAQTFVHRKPTPPTRLLSASTLVSAPEEEDFPAWDFLRDVPGLGPLIVMPARTKLHLFRREGQVWKRWCAVEIDQYSFYDTETATFRRSSAQGGSTGRPYSIRVTTVVPTLDFVEQTGDGKVDLVTSYDDRVAVYPQLEDGTNLAYTHAPAVAEGADGRGAGEPGHRGLVSDPGPRRRRHRRYGDHQDRRRHHHPLLGGADPSRAQGRRFRPCARPGLPR